MGEVLECNSKKSANRRWGGRGRRGKWGKAGQGRTGPPWPRIGGSARAGAKGMVDGAPLAPIASLESLARSPPSPRSPARPARPIRLARVARPLAPLASRNRTPVGACPRRSSARSPRCSPHTFSPQHARDVCVLCDARRARLCGGSLHVCSLNMRATRVCCRARLCGGSLHVCSRVPPHATAPRHTLHNLG